MADQHLSSDSLIALPSVPSSPTSRTFKSSKRIADENMADKQAKRARSESSVEFVGSVKTSIESSPAPSLPPNTSLDWDDIDQSKSESGLDTMDASKVYRIPIEAWTQLSKALDASISLAKAQRSLRVAKSEAHDDLSAENDHSNSTTQHDSTLVETVEHDESLLFLQDVIGKAMQQEQLSFEVKILTDADRHQNQAIQLSRKRMAAEEVSSESSARGATKFRRVGTKGFPSADIDISLLDIDISVEEILTFFPSHISWPGVMARLLRNGWSENNITAYINYARNLRGSHAFAVRDIKAHVDFAQDVEFGREYTAEERIFGDFQAVWPPVYNLKPSGCAYEGRWHRAQDHALLGLAEGVVFWPQGYGRGPLTECIAFAANGHAPGFSLEDVNWYVEAKGGVPLQMPPGESDHDRHGLIRTHDVLTNDIWRSK